MKNNISYVFAALVISLMVLLPFAVADGYKGRQDNGNSTTDSNGFGKMTREQLREKFLGENSFRAQLKEKVQNCLDDNSTECNSTREIVKDVVRGVLEKICDRSQDVLEKMRDRIESSEKLTEEEKQALIESVDAQSDKFKELCAKVPEASGQELKEISRELKNLIKETKVKYWLAKDLVHAHRVGLVIERAEHLEARLEKVSENASECNISELVENFGEKVGEARAAYNESKDLWQQFKESIKNNETNTELLRQAQDNMQLAQLKLKEAHVILKDIVSELRECKNIDKVEKAEEDKETEEPEQENESEE